MRGERSPGEDNDRPWFAEHGGAVYLVSTENLVAPKKVQLRSSTDGRGGYALVKTIDEGDVGAHNFTIAPDGTFYVPYWDGAGVTLAIGTNGGTTWRYEAIPGAISGGSHPMSALDAAGNYYFAWRDGASIRYAVRLPSPAWRGPHTVSSSPTASTWGSAIVAGATGKIDVAWYSQDLGKDAHLRFVQVLEADSSTPSMSDEVDVMLAMQGPGWTTPIKDFFTMTKSSDGHAVIAFVCRWLPPTGLPPPQGTPCAMDGDPHPIVAFQNAGPPI